MDVTTTDSVTTDPLPVDRDYDFDSYVPDTDSMPTYHPVADEDDKIMASIRSRERSDQLPRFLVGGPTGSGKTHLARSIAGRLGMPLFTIQGGHGNRESDLLGSLSLIGGDTVWTDGVLTKTLLSSAERPTVLLLDEVNRTPPTAKGFLYAALDNRGEAVINARGGERVVGDPENLITISTINDGPGHFTEQLDLAERRRLMSAGRFDIDFLGMVSPRAEVDLIVERTPLDLDDAERFLYVANQIRETAQTPSSDIPMGVSTSVLLSWIDASVAYADHDINDPVFEAMCATVADPFFSDNDDAHNAVCGMVRGSVVDRIELN